jgi:SlyX protein
VSRGPRLEYVPAMDSLEPRFVDLELRFMKLERYAQELSDVVAEQQRQLDALTMETKHLRERAAQGEPAAGNDRPPHY